MTVDIIDGDLLDQDVEVIVNAWNRNIIPWWLLLPQGVSRAVKRRAGYAPFRDLAKHCPIALGEAVLTGPGRSPYQGIIHVAGINAFWFANECSIRGSVRSAMRIVNEQGFRSVAFPIIGAGSRSYKLDKALELMLDELTQIQSDARVCIVRWRKKA